MEKTTEFYDQYNAKISLYSNRNCYSKINDKEIINAVHENLEEISNDDLTNLDANILNKIMTPEKMFKEYLTFDLLNFTLDESKKFKELTETINFALSALIKYQYRIGGFYIEDDSWIIADKTCQRFKIKENQMILYNSIHKKNCDKELIWFLESIKNYINRNVDKNKIEVKYSMFEDERNCLCWIIFKLTKLNSDTEANSSRDKLYAELEMIKEREELNQKQLNQKH